MASKQDNYLRMHHPSIYKGMRKGGEVKKKNYYAEGGKNTDTVPAMLTPGEVVLNAEQQESLGKLVGMKPAALFEKIGIPGFAGGGMVDKKNVLLNHYEDGGIVNTMKRVREDAEKAGHTETMYGFPKSKSISYKTGSALVGDKFNIGDIVKTIDTDYFEVKKQRLQDDKKRRLAK